VAVFGGSDSALSSIDELSLIDEHQTTALLLHELQRKIYGFAVSCAEFPCIEVLWVSGSSRCSCLAGTRAIRMPALYELTACSNHSNSLPCITAAQLSSTQLEVEQA
jgi:hypothetical protein